MPLLIRTATEADLPLIAAIQVASWQDAFRGIVPDGTLDGLSVERSRDMLRKTFEAYPSNITVALNGAGTATGFSCAGRVSDETNAPYQFRVFALHVRPDMRQQGIGKALLHEAFGRAVRDEGLDSAIVWTLADLHRSRRFYEREGGVLVKTDVWHVGDAALPEVAYGWDRLGG
jgi:GNAT superfamily N-acetyltransferase